MVISTIGGVVALALAGVFFYLKKVPKITAILALAGGSGVTGGIGGHLLTQSVTWTSTMLGQITATVVGIAVPFILAIVLAIIFVHDVWPKNKATKRTAGIGLVLPTLVAGIPGSAGLAATSAIAMFGTLMSNLVGSIF
jgi:hypothetical protein